MSLFAQPTPIQPLRIGDTLPDITVSGVVNYPVSTIRLSDLKGKPLILDFWGKYCGPCILALHQLDSLRQAFNQEFTVLTVSDFTDSTDLLQTLNRYPKTKGLQLPVVLGNTALAAYFPYKLVSHLIWINANGVVQGITGGEYITANNVKLLLAGKPLNWAVKKDVMDFDYKEPLLSYSQDEASKPAQLYYSAFTSYREGIAPPNGTTCMAEEGRTFTAFYNFDLMAFAKLAIDYRIGGSRNQFVLNVKDSSRYIPPKGEGSADWKTKNTFCYYLSLPSHIPNNTIESLVKADLQKWLTTLGIQVRKEEQVREGKKTEVYLITD